MTDRRGHIFHPWLVAAYPALSLYTRNQFELPITQLLFPLGLSVAAAFFLSIVLRRFFLDTKQAAVCTSIFIILFFSYGHLHEVLNVYVLPQHFLSRHRFLIPFFFSIILYAFFGLKKIKAKSSVWGRLNEALNYFALALIVIIFFRMGYAELSKIKDSSVIRYFNGKGLPQCRAVPEKKPDIYYIILDGYARADVLRDIYHYDNGEFIRELEALGFTVAKKSHSNYHTTAYSLASSLNMDYLDEALKPVPARSQNPDIFNELVAQNRVVRTLKSMGYRVIHFASGEGLTMDSPYADTRMGDPELRHGSLGSRLNRLSVLWLQTTPLAPWADNTIHAQSYQRLKHNFDEFLKVPEMPGPKFIFFHVLAPHPPFVFDRNGNEVKHDESQPLSWAPREKYVEQLMYVNQRVLECIQAVLAGTRTTSPIVVIQSDHGPGITFEDERRWERPTALNLHERLSNFCAVQLPAAGRRMLYDSITPVNLFRVVFDSVFGADLDLLPDRMNFGVPGQPLRFCDVTSEVLGYEKK